MLERAGISIVIYQEVATMAFGLFAATKPVVTQPGLRRMLPASGAILITRSVD